jgi:hypothetical protein
MLRGIVVSTLIAALAAAAVWAEGTVAFPGAEELGIAAIELERALVTYDADRRATLRHVDGALYQLWVWADRYDGDDRQAEFINDATVYLRAVEDAVSWRLARHDSPPAEELDEETATIRLIADNLLMLAAGVPPDRPEISSDYEELRAEVKANKAAGKGDVEAQIGALRADAARLNEEAGEVEAENRQLDERASRVNDVMDFWKSIIGEDQAATHEWGKY